MAKIFISLLLIASFGGLIASLSETAKPGSFLHGFKIHVTDTIAAGLCSLHLACFK